MDRKIRRIAITVPVAIAILAGGVIIYSVLQSAAAPQADTAGQQIEAAAGAMDGHSPVSEPAMMDQAAAPDATATPECQFAEMKGRPVQMVRRAVEASGRAVRVLGQNDAATQDYNPDRVNVIHDDRGVVVDVTCG